MLPEVYCGLCHEPDHDNDCRDDNGTYGTYGTHDTTQNNDTEDNDHVDIH